KQKKKVLPLEPAINELLVMYTYLLRLKAKKQGEKMRISPSRVLSGIVSSFLMSQQQRILDEYKRVRLEDFVKRSGLRTKDGTVLIVSVLDQAGVGVADSIPLAANGHLVLLPFNKSGYFTQLHGAVIGKVPVERDSDGSRTIVRRNAYGGFRARSV